MKSASVWLIEVRGNPGESCGTICAAEAELPASQARVRFAVVHLLWLHWFHLRLKAIQAKRIVQLKLNCLELLELVAELLWCSCSPAGSSAERFLLKIQKEWNISISSLNRDNWRRTCGYVNHHHIGCGVGGETTVVAWGRRIISSDSSGAVALEETVDSF